MDQAENDFIKGVLNVVNPKDGTDYWLGDLDADRNKGLQWMTGAPMAFSNFVEDEPKGNPYLHMNFDAGLLGTPKTMQMTRTMDLFVKSSILLESTFYSF